MYTAGQRGWGRRFWVHVGAAILAGFIALWPGVVGAAAPVLDQQQLLHTTKGTADEMDIQQTILKAQTFKPSSSGTLQQVSVMLYGLCSTCSGQRVQVDIVQGLPNAGGAVLATATQTVGSGLFPETWYDISFSTPTTVVADQVYSIILTEVPPVSGGTNGSLGISYTCWGKTGGGSWPCSAGNGVDAYSRGTLWTKAGTASAWYEFIGAESGDLTFKTWMAPQNQAPTLSGVPATKTVAEDSSTTITGISAADSDVGSNPLLVTLSAGNGKLTLGTTTGLTIVSGANASSAMTFTGTLSSINTALTSFTYAPNANFAGTDTISLNVDDQGYTGDGGAKSVSGSITVTVTDVDDPPALSGLVATQTYEDTDLRMTGITVSDIDAGSGNVKLDLSASHGTLSFSSSAGLTVTGSGTKSLSATGPMASLNTALNWLYYHPDANYNGNDQLALTINDLGNTGTGGPLQASGTVSILVAAVNDPPTFTMGADQTALEDSGAHSVANWASAMSPVESGQSLTGFTVTNDNNALFSTQPAVALDGTLTYTLAANAFGSAHVTVKLVDNGDSLNGGSNTSAPQTFTITVTGINDAPSFTKGGNQTVLEDAGAQSVAGWASGISAGPNETQTLTFTVTNDNPLLFFTPPAIAANGTLTYIPAGDANGSATVTVVLSDDGGTANGGVDHTVAQTFTITVTPVNDAPSFAKGSDQSVAEDSGAQTVPNWATSLSAGPGEVQTLTFTVTNDNNPLFSAQPALAANGTLTYTPAPDANGSATVAVVLKDNGGTANGGADTSAAKTFTITVTPVNDPPSFTKGADQTVAEDSGAQSVSGWATAISKGPANESSQTLTFTATTDNDPLFATKPAVAADGTLTYTPAANANGTATVSVVLSDGLDTTGAQSFTITVTAVNDAPVISGAPATLAAFEDQDAVLNLAVADVDVGSSDLEVTLSVAHGTLSLQSEAGLVFKSGGNGQNAMKFTGPLADVNIALGTLTYRADLNYSGADTLSLGVSDQGAAGAGGTLTASASVAVTVTAVNDAPSFTKGDDQTVLEDAPLQTVAWATAMSSGPSDEAGQSLTFNVVNDNNALFAVQPAIATDGTLTYRPAPDANGQATVTVRLKDNGGTANGGSDTSAAQTFTITVTAVNDPPSFTKGGNQTVAEDAGAQSVANWAAVSKGPANEAGQTLTFTVTNTNNDLFAVQPAVSGDGTLTYTPAADANGSATVTLSLSDDGGTDNGGVATTGTQSFTISVTAVNDPPSFTKGADVAVLEDSPAQTVPGWATAISPGPADEAAQTVSFLVTNDNNGLFAVQPALSADGTLTYTPAADAWGSATVTVKLKDSGGGADTSADQTFTLTLTAVNDIPSFTKGADQALLEDAAAQSVTGWATAISKGPANEAAQTLTFHLSTNNDGLFSVLPAVSADGTLTYTLAHNANGSATVTVSLSDSGGTANGGVDTTADQTFTVTVTAVNDAPVFTKGAAVTVLEDAGAQTLDGWATGIGAGAADESAQTLTFAVSNDNNALFSTQPALSAGGTLTFTPAPDANGSATVTLSLSDDGGTDHGGADTSAAQTFTITVTAVNDVPSFTKGADQVVAEDAAAQTVPGWATALSTGPADEAGQTLAFIVTNDNNALFSTQPAVSPTGTLTYTPAPNANGSANVTVKLKDSGGGTDTSPEQSFTIDITAVNDAPAISGAPATLAAFEDRDAVISTIAVVDVDAGASDLSVSLAATHGKLTLASETGLTFQSGGNGQAAMTFTGPLAQVNAALDTLTYRGDLNYNGPDSLTLSVSDQGATGAGGALSASAAVTVTVTAVNDAPSFAKGTDQTVLEDAAAQTVTGWATALSPGPADEAAQSLSFVVSNNNNALFSVQPAIAADGTLTYKPAADANGSATVTVALKDDGLTANGGSDTSADQTFTITVTAVNDAPSFTKGADQTAAEDAGLRTVANWATAISKGPANEAGQTLTFHVTNSNNDLFAVQPAVAADGTLTYTPAANANGTATVDVYLSDDGGTDNGGVATTGTQSFTIAVSAVNDPPTFDKGTDVTVLEDGGAQTVPGWATAISPGPPDEAAQTVAFTVTNDNNALFAVQPALSADGTLTYKPADDAFGSAVVTVKLKDSGGGADTSPDQTFTIFVTAVNDIPSFTKGADQALLEDAAAQSVTGWATAISKGPANEAAQTLTFHLTTNNDGLFSVLPAVSADGTLTYTLAHNANGSATVTVSLSDSGGTANGGVDTTADQTFTVTVTAVNDAPAFTKGAPVTVPEDAGAQTLDGWATGISAGGADESAQTLTFAVSNDNNPLFSVQPALTASGTLTFTPAANANGSATVTLSLSDNGGTANGGADTSAAQTFTITVTAVNDAPSFTKGADQTVAEDAAAQTVTGWATAMSPGPADEAAQTLTFLVTSDNNALFSAQPAVSPTGTLTYTPAPNANGTATVTVKLKDSGGGTDTSPEQTFTIEITPVNDVPYFTKGADVTVPEDGGLQVLPGWATGISAGAPNESSQVLTFAVSNDKPALFAVQPAISPAGELTFTPAANANGSATVTVSLSDNAGGTDTSAAQTFTIAVSPVNDAPSFTKGADQTALEDAAAQTVTGWATALSTGPADEVGQTLTFVVSNDNNALFSAQPAISPTGTLTYTPAADANGSALVTVKLKDNGGGTDTSAEQTFTIDITPVNDQPSFTKGADQTVAEDAGAQSVANWATAISKGPANEAAQTLTFTVTNDHNALFAVQPAVASDGTLTYTPADNANGTATVTVYLSDNGGTDNGGVATTGTQSFAITVTAVNDAPSFTKGADVTVLEDAGAQTLTGWATAVKAGPPDEAAQTVTFTVTNNNHALFAVQPALSAAGTLTFTAAADANGSATVTAKLADNGGGTDTSADQTFTITVSPVNDAPSFTKGADQTVLEDAGAQSVANWATAISKGPANEADQTLTFTVTNDNHDLFAVQPAVAADGTLTYTPADNENGMATVTISLSDNGGTDNGGVAATATQQFIITVTPVNDAPTFTDAVTNREQVVSEHDALTPLAATDVDGDPLEFSLTGTLPPGITGLNRDGTFAGTVAYDAAGTYEVDIRVSDGHVSSTGHLTIYVGNVDTTPALSAIPDQRSMEGARVSLQVVGADADGDALTYSATGLPRDLSINPATGLITGQFSYVASGTYPVTVTVTDSTPTPGNAAADQASRTFTWVVSDVSLNGSPQFNGPSSISVAEGQGLPSLSGSDPDGDPISFARTSGTLPEGVSLSASGSFSGTTSYRSAGTYTISVTVRDSKGATDSGTVHITVTNTDTTPTIDAIADQASHARDVISLAVSAADRDGDTLTFRADGLPPGLSINATTGTISGQIDPGTHGEYHVQVTVTDNTPVNGAPHGASVSFLWQVQPGQGPWPIKGRVTNAVTGAALPGASIRIQTPAGGSVASATTGADGRYTTGAIAAGSYTVIVTAQGFTEQRSGLTVALLAPDDLNVALVPVSATVSGTVTDAASGESLAGSTVTLTQGSEVRTATTGADGTYRFQNVPGGKPATVTVADPDYLEAAPAAFTPEAGAEVTRNFALQPRIRLTLSGPDGTQPLPVPPIVTGTYLAGQPVSIAVNGSVLATVTADASGAFAYDLSPHANAMQFGLNTVVAQVQTPAHRSRSSNPVRFNYSPTGNVTGVVTAAETGAPLAGMTVHLQSLPGKADQATTTAGDGTFRFEKLLAGAYRLVAGTLEQPLAQAQVALAGGQTLERNLVVSNQATLTLSASPAAIVGDGAATSRIEARLLLLSGQPAAGVTVRFTTSAGSLSSASAVTDANGRAVVTLTAPMLEQISTRQEEVRATVSDAARAIVAEGSVVISFVPATITGVVMEEGRPVEGARVSVAEDFNGDGIIDFAASVLTGPDGKYVIEVPRGNWVYRANVELPAKPGAAPLTLTQSSTVGTLGGVGQSITADRAIGGQVLLSGVGGGVNGAPAVQLPPGFAIQATLRSQGGQGGRDIQVRPDGSYLIEGVPAGEYQIVVQVTAPNGQRLAGTTVHATVSENGALVLSTILIDPYGTVTDFVSGQPVTGAKVRLMWADTPLNREHGRTPNTDVQLPALANFPPANNAEPQWTDARGTFAWMVFPEGDYYLLAEQADYQDYDSRKEGRNLPAAAGEDSYVEGGVIHVGQTIVHFDFAMKPMKGVHHKYVNGFPDGEFKPDRSLTRAEAATILSRLVGPAAPAGAANLFRDVPATHWAAQAVATVAATGLMKGDPDGGFRPDAQLTRAEIAVIISRLKHLDAQPGTAFADTQGHWAEQAIRAVRLAGLMQGLPDGTFQPGRAVTRAEFVTVMNRALGRGGPAVSETQTFPDVPVTHWASGQILEAATDHSFELQADGTERYVQP